MVARDVMTTDITVLRLDDSVQHAGQLLLCCDHGALPVVDDEGNLVGLVSESDVLALAIPQYLEGTEDLSFLPKSLELPSLRDVDLAKLRIRDILRTDIMQVVDEDDPIIEVARIMVKKHVRRCPVVNGAKLVGIVRRRDLMQIIVKPAIEGTCPR